MAGSKIQLGVAMAMAMVAFATPLHAAAPNPGSESAAPALPAKQSKAMVDVLIRELNARYVFPDKAKRMEQAVRRHQRSGAYRGLDGMRLAALLTKHLQAETGDRHLQVEYSAEPLPPVEAPGLRSAEQTAAELALMRSLNFGVERVERLPFNIGYLDLRGFAPAESGGASIAAAMTLVGNAHSLIIDLRQNSGGEPSGVTLLASYFFDRPTHLVDTYFREGDRTEQSWSLDSVAGPRFGGDVYILVGKDTFSAAESFAYALQGLKRALLVGETTGGGAQPGEFVRIDPHFEAFIPNGRSISPVTGTNWEGTGVTPDAPAIADRALAAAQLLTLNKQLAAEQEERRAARLKSRIDKLTAEVSVGIPDR
jgi:hypothetical protein